MLENEPLVLVESTTAKACQSLHVVPSVLSLSWSVYPVMELPALLPAPDHAKVRFASTTAGVSVTYVGGVQAVGATRWMVLETVSPL
ncbi:hypothetical protein FACS1894184_21050 [Clostridia bacterium]|nr:hypothetical protein FACS1894184_21050 [Clostridia bacterium]GHU79287.1 hypothetical protein AGMMS49992_31070 [Clostridia bacterium]